MATTRSMPLWQSIAIIVLVLIVLALMWFLHAKSMIALDSKIFMGVVNALNKMETVKSASKVSHD